MTATMKGCETSAQHARCGNAEHKPGISQRTREAILKVASEQGYVINRVAQKLSSGQSGVVRAATAAGTEVLIYTHPEREKGPSRNVLHMLQQFTDGVVACARP